tara:strand:+ start:28347 stop:29180 length:834 start_codon:yes stop_codon:yes gene_type:complete
MSNTLDLSLKSVLDQIDERFEVIVVDDGSSDSSIDVLLRIKMNYPKLRIIPLMRDKRRKLGETRNISIRAARGEYVILHIDTDDFWEPFINSYVKVYHEIEKRLNFFDFMLSGKQINMSSRKLLLENPYPNIYYGEDRYLFNDLAVIGKILVLEHKIFRKRLNLSKKQKLFKLINSQFSLINASFRYAPNPSSLLKTYLIDILLKKKLSLKYSLINLFFIFPIYFYFIAFPNRGFKNIYKVEFYNQLILNLRNLESQTKSSHGLFDLTKEERNIFYL